MGRVENQEAIGETFEFVDQHGNKYGAKVEGPGLVRVGWYDYHGGSKRPSSTHARAFLAEKYGASFVVLYGWENHGHDGEVFAQLGRPKGEEVLLVGEIPAEICSAFPGACHVTTLQALCDALRSPTFTKAIIGNTNGIVWPENHRTVYFWSLAEGLGAAGFLTVCVVPSDDARSVRWIPYEDENGIVIEELRDLLAEATEPYIDRESDGTGKTREGCEEAEDQAIDAAFNKYAAENPRPFPPGILGVLNAETATAEEVLTAFSTPK